MPTGKGLFGIFGKKKEKKIPVEGSIRDDRSFVAQQHSCPACHTRLDDAALERNLFVCTKAECHHHFRITPVERVKFLADPGTFQEFSQEVQSMNAIGFASYDGKLAEAKNSSNTTDAVINGFAEIDGKRVVMTMMTFKFMGGSMGSVVGEKITRAIMQGIEKRLPVILFTASGGARMQEGIFSLMQMAKTSAAIAQLEEAGLPLFVVLTDPTYGGVTASFAMLGDVILAEPGAMIGFAGPRVIEGTIKQKLPEGFQTAEFLMEKGFVDAVVHRSELKKTLSFLIDTHAPKGPRIR